MVIDELMLKSLSNDRMRITNLLLKNGVKVVAKSIGGADAHIYANRWAGQSVFGMPDLSVEQDDQNRLLRVHIDGENLNQALIEQDFNPLKQGQFAIDILTVLHELQQKDLAHGAIKPTNLILSAKTRQWMLVDPAVHGDINQDLVALAEIIDSIRSVFSDIRWRVWTQKVFNGFFSSSSSARDAIYALGLDQAIDYATPTAEGNAWIGEYQSKLHSRICEDFEKRQVENRKAIEANHLSIQKEREKRQKRCSKESVRVFFARRKEFV